MLLILHYLSYITEDLYNQHSFKVGMVGSRLQSPCFLLRCMARKVFLQNIKVHGINLWDLKCHCFTILSFKT